MIAAGDPGAPDMPDLSTEILFVNQTLFDRFSAATGISLESLSTFEGIADAALRYYEWTDSLIPDDAGFEDKYPDYAPSGHFIKIANGKAYCFGNDEAWYEPGVANHYWCVYDNPEDAD